MLAAVTFAIARFVGTVGGSVSGALVVPLTALEGTETLGGVALSNAAT